MSSCTIRIGKEEDLWVCSDFHLGHDQEFIWRVRGFASSAEHETRKQPNWRILDCGVENALRRNKRHPEKGKCFFTIDEIQRIFQQKAQMKGEPDGSPVGMS